MIVMCHGGLLHATVLRGTLWFINRSDSIAAGRQAN